MSAEDRPAYVCVGGIIIDDIVFPNGETRMAVLGGGTVHAAAGMLIWGQRPGIASRVGNDLPDSARQRLERDFDLHGLVRLDLPQARAWQLFEWDGRRTEIFRVDEVEPFLYGVTPEEIATAYRVVKGVHLLRDADDLRHWRAVFPNATILWEPGQAFMVAENADAFRAGLAHIDIVSPNLLEAQQVYGFTDPAALIGAMLDDGARIAALRMGADGSLAGARGYDHLFSLPAVPVPRIVDQTGAGNTYCGAFLVGWLETGDLRRAAGYGAVAASFALEVIGVADPPADLVALRGERWRWLMERIERVRRR
jgi:sugar/nucleoside kinase (ribokinase family)